MHRFLIRKPKLSDELPCPNTSDHSINVKELLGPSSNTHSIDVNVEKNIDVRSKNKFRQYHESYLSFGLTSTLSCLW